MNYFMGLDLGGTNLKYALGDSKGNLVARFSRPSLASESQKKILDNMWQATRELLKIAKEKELKVEAVGVGTPGSVDFERGQLIGSTPNIPDWTDVEIKKYLEQKLKLPVWVDNDANLMALAEAKLGAGKGFNHVVCLTLGTGIGGGIVINGQIYRGATYAAAEIGHVTVEFEGRLCNCGSLGCLEAHAAAPAMVDKYRKKLSRAGVSFVREELTPELIFEKARLGEDLATETIQETCEYIGTGIASVVNILNPDVVVIGGGIAEAGEDFVRRIEKATKRRSMKAALRKLKIRKAKLGNDAGVIGAILLASEMVTPTKSN